ncbi:MAG: SRPBCC domain-containing protein [Chthonomonadales bacterium]
MAASISTQIEINATPEQVWRVLIDFDVYSQWNPFVVKAAGKPVVGTKLRVSIKPEKGMGITISPTVVVAEPNREFMWRGSLVIPGLMNGSHRFQIEPMEGGGVRLIHSENFVGLFVPIFMAVMRKSSEIGFEAMNVALKRRVEAGGGN